ncbi:hypothetical protein PIB30_092545 [Stylosanthes scabra]|uniref:Uncharacterized protein n=1 Tax=Stylosanthes scabra TaxID=79078 RepID=A0ABU6YTV9_9FABA|nr:hypothetical protein [Stylosanthes scabra]
MGYRDIMKELLRGNDDDDVFSFLTTCDIVKGLNNNDFADEIRKEYQYLQRERELGERIRPPSRSSAVLFAVAVNLHPSSPSYSLSCLVAVAPDLGRPLRLRHFCRSHRRSEKRVRESTVNGSVAVNLPRRASTVQISQADPSVKQP